MRLSKEFVLSVLLVLFLVFLFRVLAQLLQSGNDISFLPAFEQWHSATIPYGWLLFSQGLILAAMLCTWLYIHREQYRFKRGRAQLLLVLGSIYFLVMLVRFIFGITVLPEHRWFGATLPALFHMVLAAYLLVLGGYEATHGGRDQK